MIEVKLYYPTATQQILHDKVKISFVLPKRPLFFWVDKKIEESLNLPRGFGIGYGIVYRDLPRARLLYAPIPFNLLIGGLIWTYFWIKYGCGYWFMRHSPKRKEGKEV